MLAFSVCHLTCLPLIMSRFKLWGLLALILSAEISGRKERNRKIFQRHITLSRGLFGFNLCWYRFWLSYLSGNKRLRPSKAPGGVTAAPIPQGAGPVVSKEDEAKDQPVQEWSVSTFESNSIGAGLLCLQLTYMYVPVLTVFWLINLILFICFYVSRIVCSVKYL